MLLVRFWLLVSLIESLALLFISILSLSLILFVLLFLFSAIVTFPSLRSAYALTHSLAA
jgi:hypothetical protein